MKNSIITGIVAVLVGFAVGWVVHVPSHTTVSLGAVSSSGTTNTLTSYSQITFVPLTSTSTSLLNNGASDRAVTTSYVYCSGIGTVYTYSTGAGLASWTLQAATTSVGSLGLQGNTNYVLNTTIATATSAYYIASSTEPVPTYSGRVWPVNTYLTFNTNATSTASCSLSVFWLPL